MKTQLTSSLCPSGTRPIHLPKALLLALALGAAGAPGAEIVWTNLNGGNRNTAANWFPNTIPNAADHVAIITNAGTYSITNNASRTLGGLMIGGPSGEARSIWARLPAGPSPTR